MSPTPEPEWINLNDIDKEVVMADITNWIDARIPATQTKSVGAAVK